MIENVHLTQEDLSKKVGKSRSHITNILGLLRLPAEVQKMVTLGKISMAHARILSKLESQEKIIELSNRVINDKISVRELEDITNSDQVEKKVKIARREPKNVVSDYKYVEDILRDKLDTKVRITDTKIEIRFTNTADLNRILDIINVKE